MTKEEADLIITEQNKSKEEILKAVAKVKSDYHELCKLKDMRIAELEAQIEKMKQCGNCGNGTIGNCEYCKRKPNQTRTDTSDYWRLKEIKEK